MQDLNIGIVQFDQAWEDKQANFQKINGLVDQFDGNRDIIFLPEMFNTSFTMNTSLAETMDAQSIHFLMSLARNKKCCVGATLMIKESDKVFNRFVVVNENEVLEYYDKRHLFTLANEDRYFSAGRKRVILNINGWKLLLQTCYDLRFPVFSRNNNSELYDAIVYPANWPQKRSYAWNTLLKARAIENQSYVIGINRVGKDENDLAYSGDSTIVDFEGKQLASFDKEEMVIEQTLDYDSLTRFRTKFKFLSDADSYTLIDD